jgi:hypothetical protein
LCALDWRGRQHQHRGGGKAKATDEAAANAALRGYNPHHA